MSDFYDRAQECEQRQREEALKNQAAKMPKNRESAMECHECGDPIPEGRRKAMPGVQTCICCQTAIEHRDRLRGIS
ncbi:TraR/DksA C4-type zinc finger protein [uncultured Aquitalea sp.]|uniref:TraR/DksA C4-type zinc finger protein n=1 Tax=uncultured Aquitalea sp. TaxID=540272 RepID=UPI0025E080A9|nr:TraR/DksA C4-type zinc finger protein [uncultured Aquitalea sp.]